MGWRHGKFPVLSQLNVLTNPANIANTKAFFQLKYEGGPQTTYTLGSLCMDWEVANEGLGIPAPPWEGDQDNPWNHHDASDWRAHCLVDLDQPNAGEADGAGPSGLTVRQDLEAWIRDAILNEKHIKYKYKPKLNWTVWRADKQTLPAPSNRVNITVQGPGF